MQASLRADTASLAGTDTAWNIDTGATSHMTPHREWIRDFSPCRIPVRVATNHVVYAVGQGDVLFQPTLNGSPAQQVLFSRVLYVPALSDNLFAVFPVIRERNVHVEIGPEDITFSRDGQAIFKAEYEGNAAFLVGETIPLDEESALSASILPRSVWHKRLAHIGEGRLNQLIKGHLVDGVHVAPDTPTSKPHLCEPCLAGKQHREPFPTVNISDLGHPGRRGKGIVDDISIDDT